MEKTSDRCPVLPHDSCNVENSSSPEISITTVGDPTPEISSTDTETQLDNSNISSTEMSDVDLNTPLILPSIPLSSKDEVNSLIEEEPLILANPSASATLSEDPSTPDIEDSSVAEAAPAQETSSISKKIIFVDSPELMTKALREIDRQSKIALICQGLQVCRKIPVNLVCVGLRNGKIFLFDITDRGTWLEAGFKNLLECDSSPVLGSGKVDKVKDKVDKMKRMYERRRSSVDSDSLSEMRFNKVKLMFDCRDVSDSLLHCHDVMLDGVLDIQLLEIVHRRKFYLNHELLRDFEECLETYANDLPNKFSMNRAMEEVESAARSGSNLWTVRPLCLELVDGLIAEVNSLFTLYDVLKRNKNSEDMNLALQSSKRYANYFRSYRIFPKEEFYRNAFVPHNILIWTPREAHDPPRTCDACLKEFGMSEMSSSVIRGSTLCALCIKIVRKIKNKTGVFPELVAESHEDGDGFEISPFGTSSRRSSISNFSRISIR